MEDYYAVLDVPVDVTGRALKEAYRRKASEFHPDKNPSPEAASQFHLIQEAYELLADPTTRQTYDENRRRSLLDNPLETARQLWVNYMKKF